MRLNQPNSENGQRVSADSGYSRQIQKACQNESRFLNVINLTFLKNSNTWLWRWFGEMSDQGPDPTTRLYREPGDMRSPSLTSGHCSHALKISFVRIFSESFAEPCRVRANIQTCSESPVQSRHALKLPCIRPCKLLNLNREKIFEKKCWIWKSIVLPSPFGRGRSRSGAPHDNASLPWCLIPSLILSEPPLLGANDHAQYNVTSTHATEDPTLISVHSVR